MKKNLQMWIIVIALLILYAVSTLIVLLNPSRSELFTFLRLCGVLGLLSLGLAVIIVPFAAQLYQIFGKTFLKIHHLFAVLGVVLLTLHPVALFILTLNPLIFLPAFDSFISFWNLAGRPALILIYIGVLAALLRNYLKNSWKKFHALLYIAYIFGLIHGILIGTDFKNPFILILFSTL
ncbi:MAG: hypothetical protein ACOC44_04800, partial [Promethearchaeia archaeon]